MHQAPVRPPGQRCHLPASRTARGPRSRPPGPDTDEWKDRYATRASVEGTISQAVRVTGIRHARYRDLPATGLGHVFAATALDIIRIDRWLTGTPLGGTRTSHLESLILALRVNGRQRRGQRPARGAVQPA
ncbi:transposase [Streptomyces sp. NBC_01637]|nr:transposase [Streptomyces sp. NBC_01653]WTD37544.1 transposase [Streptomyces sp. NBC_01643]WTD92959.1 transposase [Streptomyces sp. NBC_01637]